MGNKEKLRDALDHGMILHEGRLYAEAYEHYSQLIGWAEEQGGTELLDDSLLAEIYYQRALSLIADEEQAVFQDEDTFHNAIDDLTSAIEMQPGHLGYLLSRGHLYAECRFASYINEAEADFLDIIDREENNTEALKQLGQLYLGDERFVEAILCFDRLLKLRPGDTEGFLLRAMCHYRKDPPDYQAALYNFDSAERLMPGKPELFVWRAACYDALGQHERAIEEYDNLVALDPGNGDYYVTRGDLYFSMGKKSEALRDYNHALTLAPNELAFNNRAVLKLSEGDLEGALLDAEEARATNPDAGVVYATFAEIYAVKEDRSRMYTFLTPAIQLHFQDVSELLEIEAFFPYQQEPEFLDMVIRFEEIQAEFQKAE